MDSPMDAIPSLVPTAPPSKPQIPYQSTSQAKGEEAIDKFATLFSPATPRASPTLVPIFTDASDSHPRPAPQPHQAETPTSADSDFGSFVSVSAADDPLSSFPSPGFTLPSPMQPTTTAPLSISSSSSNRTATHTKNTSLNFFDKFAEDAKRASEKNKKGVLDELLMHEQDPMYWFKNEATSESSDRGTTTEGVADPRGSQAPLVDLDFDESYFSPAVPATTSQGDQSRRSPSPPRSPPLTHTRTNSLSPSRIPAPPIASTSSAFSSDLSTPLEENTDPLNSSRPPLGSYQTLSNISSRWMPSFLSSSKSSHPSASPSLESLFINDPTVHPKSHTPPRRQTPVSSSSVPISNTHANPTLHHANTFSVPGSNLSHGTPFAPHPSSSFHPSPFAAHVYVPPTGAPGFKGDGYDWDKGYSTELERELSEDVNGHADEEGGKELVGVVNGSVVTTGVGSFIEKKSGSVELKGRREATVDVLDVGLADLIRPHLPALSRLPRTWNLLYSLDQHGISLKTLYSRCETQSQVKPGGVGSAGALVVVKDAGDAIFGAWMGEGIQLSRGKGYYGSGESFLWKYTRGKFEIFKWTGKNNYVALCEPEYISFGGGDGNYGLYLDDTLYDGSSARCPTFENEPLCSAGPKKGGAVAFECVGLEVWGVGP